MPWGQTDPVRERLRFVALHQEGLYSMGVGQQNTMHLDQVHITFIVVFII